MSLPAKHLSHVPQYPWYSLLESMKLTLLPPTNYHTKKTTPLCQSYTGIHSSITWGLCRLKSKYRNPKNADADEINPAPVNIYESRSLQGLWGMFKIFQINFPNKDTLESQASFTPRPPYFLGHVTISYLTRCNPLPDSLLSHIKLRTTLSITMQVAWGSQ